MKKINSTEQARQAVVHAMKRQRPVTITYTRANGSETVRTIEPYALTRSAAGDPYVRAMDRESGESRTWRLDRISSLTEHRTAFLVPVPEPKSDASRLTAVRMTEAAPVVMQRVYAATVRRAVTV